MALTSAKALLPSTSNAVQTARVCLDPQTATELLTVEVGLWPSLPCDEVVRTARVESIIVVEDESCPSLL